MWRSQEAARTTKRKTPKCARKIAALLRPFVRGALPMGFPRVFRFSPATSLDYAGGFSVAWDSRSELSKRYRPTDFATCTKVQGKLRGRKSNEDERRQGEDFCSCAGEQDCGHCRH